MRAALAGWFALCGTLAHAGLLSVTAVQSGDIVTVTVEDSAAGDMCWGGLCGADFLIDYNPAILEFLFDNTTSDFLALAYALPGEPVLVSLIGDPDDFPVSNELFSLGFRVLAGGEQVTLTVSPRDFDVPGTYMPGSQTILLDVVDPGTTVPEPNSALLAMLALAVLAWRRQTNLAQDQRSLPPA